MSSKFIERVPEDQIAIVLHPDTDFSSSLTAPEARLEEAQGLAQAVDIEVVAAQIVRVRKAVPATLFGSGKVREIGDLIFEHSANVVVVDTALTPIQQRNLEKEWDIKVIDRTGLILEIFAKRARTREGKLQVELARLDYERSRLVRTWTHLERQRAAVGTTGGPGETQIELDRRMIADRIVRLKTELEEVRRTRALHRSARKRVPYPVIALVGYTNAGKSTLFNALTRAEVMAKDMLFATLDPTLRTLKLPQGRPAILSDTVGFISDLPHELVAAFRATLEEVAEADLIVHVRDLSNPDTEAQAREVMAVLKQIEPENGPQKMLEVWNKIDLLPEDERGLLMARAVRLSDAADQAPPVPVSAITGEGLENLRVLLADLIEDGAEQTITLAPHQGQILAWLYQHGRIVHRQDDEAGLVHLTVKLSNQSLGRFEQMMGYVKPRNDWE